MMKTIKNIVWVAIFAVSAVSCIPDGGTKTAPTVEVPTTNVKNVGDKPLNISVYLDLSDRIVHGTDGMEQSAKDIEIVGHLADIFYSSVAKKRERQVVDRMKVFFYPTPTISDVNNLAKGLVIDLGTTIDKLGTLKSMKNKFHTNLEQIYENAIQSNNFLGSDLWGFFNNQVDVQCIKKDYRNILVILTDGYVYHKNNLVTQNGACSYISKRTLHNGTPLIIGRTGLENLEVLVLETNPNPNTDLPKLQMTLGNWFKGMGIEKVRVVKTDTPTNIVPFIDNFFDIN